MADDMNRTAVGEAGHRQGSGVVSVAFPRLPVSLRVAGFERAFARIPRPEEIAGKVTHHGEGAVGDGGLHDATRVLRFI